MQHQGEPAALNEGNNESQTGNNFIGEKKGILTYFLDLLNSSNKRQFPYLQW